MKTYLVRLEVKEIDSSKLVYGVTTIFDHALLGLEESDAWAIMLSFKGIRDIVDGKKTAGNTKT